MGAGPAPPPRPPQTGRPAPAPASLRARRERNGAPRASRFINDFLVTISQTASYADTWILQNLFTLPFFFFPSKNTHTQTRPLLRADSLESEVHPAFRPPGAAALRGPAGFLPIRSSEHPQVSRSGLFHSYPRQAPSGRPRRARCDGLGLIQRWSGRQSPLARV